MNFSVSILFTELSRIETSISSTEFSPNPSTDISEPARSSEDVRPRRVPHFCTADASEDIRRCSRIQWIDRALDEEVLLNVFATYSPDKVVVELPVCLFQADGAQEVFRIHFPNASQERLTCETINKRQCASLWLLRTTLQNYGHNSKGRFTYDQVQGYFQRLGEQLRCAHPWVKDAHLKEVGYEVWYWLCHSFQRLTEVDL